MDRTANLVAELKMLMQTSFNGMGWVRAKEILIELGIDPKISGPKLLAKLEEITNQKMDRSEGP
jgi:hypothetical protein